ncbi:MAG TPA: DinB family protein [Moheibacter sp.]|nr:DinB family protein [Moheibacter sp.]
MKKTSMHLFEEMNLLLQQLTNQAYGQSLAVLNGNSIGKHFRHILELFEALLKGNALGTLNYEDRKRDVELENSIAAFRERLASMVEEIQTLNLTKKMHLQQYFNGQLIEIETSVQRELLYNIEHCIHHLAIIRIGIEQHFPHIILSEQFGVAHTTLRYRESIQA